MGEIPIGCAGPAILRRTRRGRLRRPLVVVLRDLHSQHVLWSLPLVRDYFNLRLSVIPSPVWTMGDHYWRASARRGKVRGRVEPFHRRLLLACNLDEPAFWI